MIYQFSNTLEIVNYGAYKPQEKYLFYIKLDNSSRINKWYISRFKLIGEV